MDQNKLHLAIAHLAKFPSGKDPRAEYMDVLQAGVFNALKALSPCEELEPQINGTDKITMQFIYVSLQTLKKLSECSKDDTVANLMSVQQQQRIKILLQLIFSIGILPSLVRGVDIALANKTVQLELFDLEDWSLIESYNMMREIVRQLLDFLKSPNLRSLILIHLGDLMAALLQLIHIGDIKKPAKITVSHEIGCTHDCSSTFVMTEEWHDMLVQDRVEFRAAYNELVGGIYKPLVIRELLILMSPVKFIEGGKELTPPSWLRRVVSSQLSKYLTSPGGVPLIMRAMCDSSSHIVDWKKVDAMAKLISTVHGNYTTEDFYSSVSPQIIALLNTTGAYCIPVAKKCLNNIYHDNPEICNKYILEILFEPFIICSKPVKENFDGTLIDEDLMSRCIDDINKCFTPGTRESALPFKALIKIIKIKFKLYMKVTGGLYQHQSAIQDLLLRFFHSFVDLEKLIPIYRALIFDEPHKDMLEMNDGLEFEFAPSGGVQVVTKRAKAAFISDSQLELSSEVAGDFLLDLLTSSEEASKKLLYGLFLSLLSTMMSISFDEPFELPGGNPDLMDADELIVFIVAKSQKKMVTVKMLALLAENDWVVEGIQSNPEHVIGFLEKLLEKKAEGFLQDKENEAEHAEEGNEEDDGDLLQDIVVILGILDIMTMNLKPGSDKWADYKPMLNSVKVIMDHCKDAFVKFLASLMYERILTYGAVNNAKKSHKAMQKEKKRVATEQPAKTEPKVKMKSEPKKNKKLIVELSEKTEKAALARALEEVCSMDIPTKGHGLIELRKLVKKGGRDAMARKDLILSVFKQDLKHEDSYVYLSAIAGLEVMAEWHTGVVIDCLIEEMMHREDVELKMKIGEVLVSVTRNLGDLAPKYKTLLINTFLFGAKDDDEYLRASNLSNLGELLKVLGYSVGSILQEVCAGVERIAATDTSGLVRRAAVLVMELLLKGVPEHSFMILEPVIRDLYRTLVHINKTDKDDVTRLHAELALAEVDRLVRGGLTAPVKLEKRISVLDFQS